MFDAHEIVTGELAKTLGAAFHAQFPNADTELHDILQQTTLDVMALLHQTSAIYHNSEHTILVVLAGVDILQGKRDDPEFSALDWIHIICALLAHDVGYSATACPGDTRQERVIAQDGSKFRPPKGASDACLAPYHVDRSMIFALHYFQDHAIVSGARIAAAIDFTRFPVPDAAHYSSTACEGGLVRAADLIGQLADPLYPQKLHKLYFEMLETGVAEKIGYTSALDMLETFLNFYQTQVVPLIGPALSLLKKTKQGHIWIDRLATTLARAETK